MERMDQFFSQFPTRSYPKGEVIIQQGEVPSTGYVVRQGAVKIYSIDNSGTERPVVFDIRNEMFPIGWIFGKIDHAAYFYEAFTDVTVCQVDREEFLAGLKKDPLLMFEVFEYYVRRHLDLQLRIEGLEQSRAQAKILYTLKFLCSRFGESKAGQKIEIHLPLTQQDIANFLGITRETAAIELKKLEKRGIIAHHHTFYIIHEEKLTTALDEA
jgi:CRP/FNR family transcriptional regulator